MDPDATLRIIGECTREERRQRSEACENLDEWLQRGGFEPDWEAQPRAARLFNNWRADRERRG